MFKGHRGAGQNQNQNSRTLCSGNTQSELWVFFYDNCAVTSCQRSGTSWRDTQKVHMQRLTKTPRVCLCICSVLDSIFIDNRKSCRSALPEEETSRKCSRYLGAGVSLPPFPSFLPPLCSLSLSLPLFFESGSQDTGPDSHPSIFTLEVNCSSDGEDEEMEKELEEETGGHVNPGVHQRGRTDTDHGPGAGAGAGSSPPGFSTWPSFLLAVSPLTVRAVTSTTSLLPRSLAPYLLSSVLLSSVLFSSFSESLSSDLDLKSTRSVWWHVSLQESFFFFFEWFHFSIVVKQGGRNAMFWCRC